MHAQDRHRARVVWSTGGQVGSTSRRRWNAAAPSAGRQGSSAAAHSVRETIDAREAWRIGLVNEVVPAADLIARSEAILKQIASNAPIAVKLALEATNRGLETSQDEGMLLEASYFGLCAATEDKKEGTRAFLERRAPQFHGR